MTTAWKAQQAIQCPVCCKKFIPSSPKQKFCSDKCSRIMRPSNFTHRRQVEAQKKVDKQKKLEQNLKPIELTELEQAREARINVGPKPAACACCPCYVRNGGTINPCSHPRLAFSLMGVAAYRVRMQNKCPWGLLVARGNISKAMRT